jgi:hypothetical protein
MYVRMCVLLVPELLGGTDSYSVTEVFTRHWSMAGECKHSRSKNGTRQMGPKLQTDNSMENGYTDFD